MAAATLVDVVQTYSQVPQIIALYKYDTDVPAGLQTPAPVEITLLAPSNDMYSYLKVPNNDLSGQTFIFNIENMSIASSSNNFDIRFFNKYDPNPNVLVNSIHEVVVYHGVTYSTVDSTFNTFIVRNRDNPPTNKIYFHIVNYAGMGTGVTYIELVYQCYQDRPF